MQTNEQVLYDQIKSIVSGGVGQNHSLIGDVGLQDCLGIRKVQISIIHEANASKEGNLDRIKEDMAPIAQQIVTNLANAGYSVTETKNFTYFIRNDDRAELLFRCSLSTILKQQAPPPETSTIDLAITPNSGPAVIFGK